MRQADFITALYLIKKKLTEHTYSEDITRDKICTNADHRLVSNTVQ